MAFSLWTHAYLTLEDVRSFMRGNPETATDEDFLGGLINASCQAVENHLGRAIKSRSVTEYRDGNGADFIYPRNPPVASLTIHLDASRQWAASELLQATTPIALDDEYFYDDAKNCVELLGWRLPGSPDRPVKAIIRLTYTGGWAHTTTGTWPGVTVSSSSIPAAIRDATLLTVQNLHNQAGAGKGLLGMSAVSSSEAGSAAPVVTPESQTVIPPLARKMLAPYRKVRIA